MECTLDTENAGIIAKAIQSLGKFGADLYIEADEQGLQLRTLNQSRSAAGSLKFKRSFFSRYNVGPNGDSYCRISMKAALAIFRNMRQVEHCDINMQPDADKFQVKLTCRLDTVKTALIFVVEDENITAAVTPDSTSNVITGFHKVFSEISNNFNTSEEEITLEAMKENLTAKNYIEGARVTDKFMRSQLKLEPDEFETYKINKETIITFCLKEFRAFLHFAEAINCQITLNFDESGSPVFLNISKSNEIECQLIMSTLDPDDVSFSAERCRNDDLTDADLIAATDTLMENSNLNISKEINKNTNSKKVATKRKRKQLEHNDTTRNTTNASKTRRRLAEQTTLSNTTSVFANLNTPANQRRRSLRSADGLRNNNHNNNVLLAGSTIDHGPSAVINLNAVAESASEKSDYNEMETEVDLSTYFHGNQHELDNEAENVNDGYVNDDDEMRTTCVDNLKKSQAKSTETDVAFIDTEDTEKATESRNMEKPLEEYIPQSPQRQHKIRSIFSRCFEATCKPMELSLDSQFYVADSDSE